MKKHLTIGLLSTLLFLCWASPGLALEKQYDFFKNLKLVVGEKEASINDTPAVMEQAAYVKSGRTLVPFRFLGEALGAEVSWNELTKQAKLKTSDTEVIVTIGSKAAYIDGELTTLDVPAETKGGRTFIPLRFVSEALGSIVNYDDETQLIEVRYVNMADWSTYTHPLTELKFRHPADWEVTTENDAETVVFTSPTGTKMFVNLENSTPEQVSTYLKELATKNNWRLESEYLDVEDAINEGFELDYSKYDAERNTKFWYAIFCDPLNQLSLVGEVLAVDENYDEIMIMAKILLS